MKQARSERRFFGRAEEAAHGVIEGEFAVRPAALPPPALGGKPALRWVYKPHKRNRSAFGLIELVWFLFSVATACALAIVVGVGLYIWAAFAR